MADTIICQHGIVKRHCDECRRETEMLEMASQAAQARRIVAPADPTPSVPSPEMRELV
jgi:hypothetical protein